MEDHETSQFGEALSAPPDRAGSAPRRILEVEDDVDIRQINTEMLTRNACQVDAAEDGAAAWDTLQNRRYDLVVTDNDMPKVSGVELIEKIHAAGLALPVIMATGASPKAHFTLRPWLQPAAILLKPCSCKDLLMTVKCVLSQAILAAALLMFFAGFVHAQDAAPAPDISTRHVAMTLSVLGQCEYSDDGITFAPLAKGHVVEQGATVRTGQDARADLFFRRTGTTVRLQAGTVLKLEKMTLTMKDGQPFVHTLLDLRTGRIFTVVRSQVAGSTLEIRNAAGRSVVEGSGVGRYSITADGSHVSAKGSVILLKVIGEDGITVVAAGQQFEKKEGKMLPVSPSLCVKELIELDELQAATEEPTANQPSTTP